jgi:hypothetical protein
MLLTLLPLCVAADRTTIESKTTEIAALKIDTAEDHEGRAVVVFLTRDLNEKGGAQVDPPRQTLNLGRRRTS